MTPPLEHPPRLPGDTAQYEDDPFDLGKIEGENLVVVEDFLPRPVLVRRRTPKRSSSNPDVEAPA